MFHNVDTGAYSVSIIQNNSVAITYQLGSTSSDFVFVAIGDYNGDGRSDVLFKNVVTGDYWAWMVNNATITVAVDYGSTGPSFSALAGAPAARPQLPALGFFEDASGGVHQWSLAGAAGGATALLGAAAPARLCSRSEISTATISPTCCLKASPASTRFGARNRRRDLGGEYWDAGRRPAVQGPWRFQRRREE